jgi:hypothetical protein
LEIRFNEKRESGASKNLPLLEIARVLVCFDHVASRIVKANQSTASNTALEETVVLR